jgi:hypothetical protein
MRDRENDLKKLGKISPDVVIFSRRSPFSRTGLPEPQGLGAGDPKDYVLNTELKQEM